MAIKRRDVVLPVGTTPDIVTESPAGHSKPSTGSYYNKPGSGLISSCNSRNARIIAAGVLAVLMIVFGTRYVYLTSSRTTTHTLTSTHFLPTTLMSTRTWYLTHAPTGLIHHHSYDSRPLFRQLSQGASLSLDDV